jgi:hypothetical protein
MLRKIGIIAVLSLIIAAVAAAPVLAANAHFIGTPEATKSNSGVLTVTGKAAGLGNGPTAAFLTADRVIATFRCVNRGGNIAPGQPVVLQDVEGPTQNINPRNGQITFSPTLSPPPTPSAADECPNGNWRVQRTSLTYENVVLHIEQPPGTEVLSFSFGDIDP